MSHTLPYWTKYCNLGVQLVFRLYHFMVPPVKPIRICYINMKIGVDMIVSRIWLNDLE